MWFLRVLALLGMIAMVGCDAGAPPPQDSSSEADSLVEGVKSAVEGIAATGQIDEGFQEAQSMASDLNDLDSAKGGSLVKDLQDLKALSSPAEIKAKAKEIAAKL